MHINLILIADLAPLSYGGEGFMEAIITGMGGYKKTCRVHNTLIRPITAEVGFKLAKS